MAAPTIPYTIPGTVGHANVAGQKLPEIICRIAFDGAQEPDPTWVDVSDRLRAWTVERGGENELEGIDTGTCSVVLENADRALDPFNTSSPHNPNVKPRRRLWLQAQWAGQTKDLFYGWTGAFKPDWPGLGYDSIVSLSAQDGSAIMAMDALPTTSPPRDSYGDVVLFDQPRGYWRFNDVPAFVHGNEVPNHGARGTAGVLTGTTLGTSTPTQGNSLIIGDSTDHGLDCEPNTWMDIPASTENGVRVGPGNLDHLSTWAVEVLVRLETAPAATSNFFAGPVATNGTGSNNQWRLRVNHLTLKIEGIFVPKTTGAVVTVTGDTVLTVGTTYHVVMTHTGAALKLYVNNTEEDSVASSADIEPADSDTERAVLGGTDFDGTFDEAAIYAHDLTASRVSAHYTAAFDRGRPQELTSNRILGLLEEAGLGFLPRRLRAAARNVQPVYFTGQNPRGEMEDACRAEGDPAVCFFAGDGAVVFLDRNHRSASPWNTVQATFDDDGTDLPYHSIEIDDGEAFIYNDVRVTAKGGTLQQSTDSTSIGRYQRRVLDRGETLNVDDTDADAEADALLAKYKDPLPRITKLVISGSSSNVLTQMITREIGDQVRVFRRPTGGGSVIDQSSHIRKIKLSGDASTDRYWTCEWSLSQR